MGKFASGTSVSASSSLNEIERILTRYGADQFAFGHDNDAHRAFVTFRMNRRQIKFLLLPDPNDPQFLRTPAKRIQRSPAAARETYEQAVRQRWRALTLCIKAKLESIESGIEDFETAFMGQIMLPSGATVGDWMKPQIERAYTDGQMPNMLPMLGDGR